MGKILIIGGANGLGFWIVNYLKEKSFSLSVLDIDSSKKQYFDKINIPFFDNYESVNFKEYSIIIVSVPINVFENVVKNISNEISKETILIDVSSLKKLPVNVFKKYVDPNVCIIPTHPMFGPTTKSLNNQNIIITPDQKTVDDPRYKKIINFLKKEGLKIVITTPEKHDQIMAIVQGLIHFNIISFAYTLKKLNIDIGETKNFSSPVYEIILSFVGRIIQQNPELYANIQFFNPEVKKVHKTYIKNCERLYEIIKNKDLKKFTGFMKKGDSHFKPYSFEFEHFTEKIIFLLSKEIEELKKRIGDEIKIKNLEDNKIYSGILKNVNKDEIHIKIGKTEKRFNLHTIEVL